MAGGAHTRNWPTGATGSPAPSSKTTALSPATASWSARRTIRRCWPAWLAATKAGAVVVNTMPMLRAGELTKIVDKAEIGLALCDTPPPATNWSPAPRTSRFLKTRRRFRRHRQPRRRTRPRGARQAGRLRRRARPDATMWRCSASPPARPAQPKATMHFHRDLLIIADGYARRSARASRRTTCSSARRRSPSPSGSADWRSSRFASARPRRCSKTPRRRTWSRSSRPTRRRSASPRRPPIARCWRRWTKAPISPRCALRCPPARRLPAPVYEDWIRKHRRADPRRHRLDGNAAYLHRQPPRRLGPGATGRPRRATKPGSSTTT